MFTFSLTLVRHGETQYNKDKLLQGQGVDTVLSETGVQQGEAVGRYLADIRFNNVFVSNLQRAQQVCHNFVIQSDIRKRSPVLVFNRRGRTAELILRNNAHCSDAEMVLEPLLRERCFGIAEGRPKEDLKNMANASGMACRDYTPPGGETFDQVRLRFKKFLKILFSHMVDEHGWSAPDAPEGALEAASDAPDSGLADDGLHGVSVHALVVSHGTYMCAAIRHLIEDVKCSLPDGAKISRLTAPVPNTGISRFIFTLTKCESGPVLSAARCVFTNRKDHLEILKAAEH